MTGEGIMDTDIGSIDFSSQSFMRDPLPTLARLVKAGPMVRVRLPFIGETWVVTTHEAVNELLKNDHTFVRNPKNVGKSIIPGLPAWCLPPTLTAMSQNMLGHDDPDHRRLRKLVDQAFNRQSVEGMRGRIGALCDGLLDRMGKSGRSDLMEGFARPLPLAVICELLGLPEQDRGRFTSWVRSLMSTKSLVDILWVLPGMFSLRRYFERQFEQVRRHPRPGLMTALVQAEHDGDKLTHDELVAMAFLLLLAGHETTVHLIAGGVLSLLEHPDQKARLMADWSLAPSAVEEVLRWYCPVQFTKPRYAVCDMEFHGQRLKRGDLVMALLAAANVDPARFPDPEQMDITRSPNPQVTFGTGIHICLGAQLARVEAQVALEKLFTRFPGLSLAGPASKLRYVGRLGLRALTAFPVRLT
jgi:cytochrome P450